MFTAFGVMCCLLCADCVASDRLEMIDPAECWNNVLWNIVDSVAGRLMDAGGSSRDLFQVAEPSPPWPTSVDGQNESRRRIQVHERHSVMLDEFISQHCAVFRRGGLDESDLRLKGITNAPNYSTQSFWLARICALGRIPRKDLEQALEGTLSFGFTPKCNTRCRGHKRYDCETWTTAMMESVLLKRTGCLLQTKPFKSATCLSATEKQGEQRRKGRNRQEKEWGMPRAEVKT
jgi:hypothetical protein